MEKFIDFINKMNREVMFQIIKRKSKEYHSFEIEEDGKKFIVSLNFDTFVSNKDEISIFIEQSLKQEFIDIFTVLEVVRIMYDVSYFTEGVDGTRVNIFFY